MLETGKVYEVEYRTVQNRPDWTMSRTLEFRGFDDNHAVFEVAGAYHQQKPIRLAAWQLVEIEEAADDEVDVEVVEDIVNGFDSFLRKAAGR